MKSSSSHENHAMARLAKIARHLSKDHSKKLRQLKREGKSLRKRDFIWEELLRSFSVMQSSRGYEGLMENTENHNAVTYQALKKLSRSRRRQVLRRILKKAKVRLANKKASWLHKDFDLIEKMRGPRACTKLLLSQSGKDDKIQFLKKFDGIGDKNARNVMMNLYHPDFLDSIAVDLRIVSVSKELGLRFKSFDDHEQFYRRVAKRAGLSSWELDRLLYNFKDEFLSRLDY